MESLESDTSDNRGAAVKRSQPKDDNTAARVQPRLGPTDRKPTRPKKPEPPKPKQLNIGCNQCGKKLKNVRTLTKHYTNCHRGMSEHHQAAMAAATATPIGKEKCLTAKAVKTRAAAHRETTPEARSVLEDDLYISVSEKEPDDEETETVTKPIDWKLKPIDPRTTERMAMTAVEAAIKIPSQVLAAVIDAEDQLSTEEVTQKLMNDWHVPPVAKCIVRRRVADVKAVQARRKLKEFGLAPMPQDA